MIWTYRFSVFNNPIESTGAIERPMLLTERAITRMILIAAIENWLIKLGE